MLVNSIMPGLEPDKLKPQEIIRITRELVGMAQPNFFVTKTYMPKQMDRLIIHIGQTHAPLTSDYRDIHAHEVRETLSIQQQIHALGQLWHKHHPSLGLYFEGESYTPQILAMTKKIACQFAQ